MESVYIVLAAVAGLFVGSAVWVVAGNQANRRTLLAPPRCAADGFAERTGRKAVDDVGEARPDGDPGDPTRGCRGELPLIAWLPLYGFGLARRCPACGRAQPVWRVAFELAVAGYFALVVERFSGLELAESLVLAVPLLVILLVDAWTRLIYTNVILLGGVLGLGFAALHGWRTLLDAVLAGVGAVVAFGLLFVLAAVIYRNVRVVPFGLGDVYLAGVIGAMTRLPDVIAALFAGIVVAGVVLLLLLLTGKVGRRTPVPYGPFLCLGALLLLVTPG